MARSDEGEAIGPCCLGPGHEYRVTRDRRDRTKTLWAATVDRTGNIWSQGAPISSRHQEVEIITNSYC
jgi:hypothetical protein